MFDLPNGTYILCFSGFLPSIFGQNDMIEFPGPSRLLLWMYLTFSPVWLFFSFKCPINFLVSFFPENNYRLFCIALGQRYIEPAEKCENKFDDIYALFFSREGVKELKQTMKTMNSEEKTKLYKAIEAIHEDSFEIFRAMPSKLMLVTR